jgi:hypothetical protein
MDTFGLSCSRPGGHKKGDVNRHGNLSPQKNRASGHKNTKADSYIQSHHSIQDAWARRNKKGYSRNKAPATLLPSSSGMSHTRISASQRARRSQPNGLNNTLKYEFNTVYKEMLDSGVPIKQAKKAYKDAYKYFDRLRSQNVGNPVFDI